MNKIIIDEEKCIGCSLCVNDCPNCCLHLEYGKAHADNTGCIECGHCYAVCPQGAIRMSEYKCEDEPVVPMTEIDSDTLLSGMRSRRTIRHFTTQPVEEEKIIRIPDGFFAKVKDLAEECNLYELANWSIRPPAFKSGEDDYYEFTLETTDGRQFNGWYQGEEIPEEMAAIKEKVVAFYEQALAQGEAYSATH